MSLSMSGTDILEYEVTNIDKHGFWLLVEDKEYFVSFEDYPAFKKATIEQMLNVHREGPGQFNWPDLDADIELEALDFPEHFPLQYTKK